MLNKEQIKQARKEVSEKIISLPEGPQRICYEIFRKALNNVLFGGGVKKKNEKKI